MFEWLAQEPDLGPWVERGGIIGLLALAVLSFMREWLVTGATYRRSLSDCERVVQQAIADRDRALDALDKYSQIAQRALEAAERKT